jgi:hypothetical protein
MTSASSINPRTGYVESIAAGTRALKLEQMTLQLVRFDHIRGFGALIFFRERRGKGQRL